MSYPRKLSPLKDGMTYHCQDPAEKMGVALCGMDVPAHAYKNTYDYPEDFFTNTGYTIRVVRCEKCLAHPDVPLLALGAV